MERVAGEASRKGSLATVEVYDNLGGNADENLAVSYSSSSGSAGFLVAVIFAEFRVAVALKVSRCEVVTSERHASSLNSDPLSATRRPIRAGSRPSRRIPPSKMSSIHTARRLLGSTVKSHRPVAFGRAYATKQPSINPLVQKTKSRS